MSEKNLNFTREIDFMDNKIVPIFLRYGGAEKDTSEMTREELEQAASSILRRAKEKAFIKGRPIVFSEKGKIYEEWPDGRIIEVKTAG